MMIITMEMRYMRGISEGGRRAYVLATTIKQRIEEMTGAMVLLEVRPFELTNGHGHFSLIATVYTSEVMDVAMPLSAAAIARMKIAAYPDETVECFITTHVTRQNANVVRESGTRIPE